jgi:hypothetical protein
MPKAHPIWTKEWISTATLNVANGSHGNTLTEVDSPFIFIDKETLSFRSEGISYIIRLILVMPSIMNKISKVFNSIVGMDPMATHCRKLIVTGIYQANSYLKCKHPRKCRNWICTQSYNFSTRSGVVCGFQFTALLKMWFTLSELLLIHSG